MKLKPFDSHFLPPTPDSRTNTDSVHKTHFEIQDEKIHTTKFVFVSVRDSHEYIRALEKKIRRFRSHHGNVGAVYEKRITHRRHAEWLLRWGGGLVCRLLVF